MSDGDLVSAALRRVFVTSEWATNLHRAAAEYWLAKGRADRSQTANAAADETAQRADQARRRLEELGRFEQPRRLEELALHRRAVDEFATASGF
jgi:hypothetical protein